jgi:hypothetical protein
MKHLLALLISFALFTGAVSADVVESHGAIPTGISSGGISVANPACDTTIPFGVTTASTTTSQAIVGQTGKITYICGVYLSLSTVTAIPGTAQFEYGTGSGCTSPTVISAAINTGAAVTTTLPIMLAAGNGTIFRAPAGTYVCIITTGLTTNVYGWLNYAQY